MNNMRKLLSLGLGGIMLAMALAVSASAADATKPDVRANKVAANQNLSKRKMFSRSEEHTSELQSR